MAGVPPSPAGTPLESSRESMGTFLGTHQRAVANEMAADAIPSLISKPSSIRRDFRGHLVEGCLTPRSRLLRDMVAEELRVEVLQNQGFEAVPHHPEVDDVDVFLRLSWPELFHHWSSKPTHIRKSAMGATSSADVQVAIFHQVMILLLRDSICWNRLVAVEALCIDQFRNFATKYGTDVLSSVSECLKDEFLPVRRFAIEGLRLLGKDAEMASGGAPHLKHAALHDSDWRLRAEAVRALQALGTNAIPHLTSIMEESTWWPLRAEAALALGSVLGGQDEMPADSKLAICNALTVALEDRTAGVREAVAKALGNMGPNALSVVHPLIRLTRDEDLRVRIASVTSLGQIVGGAAPKQAKLRYGHLMQKRDINRPECFADLLRLTCRALTRTLRDQEPLFKVATDLAELTSQVQDFQGSSIMMASAARQRQTAELEARSRHVKELFHAAEVSFKLMGAYAGPNIIARLIEEDEAHGGFGNRMSLLRGIHCIGSGFDTDDWVCAILSEWVSAPVLGDNLYAQSMTVVANTLPVSGLHLDTFTQEDSGSLRYAVLHGDAGDLYVVFGVMNHMDAVHDMLSFENMEPRIVRIPAARSGDEDSCGRSPSLGSGGSERGRPTFVHSGMWSSLDGIWGGVCQSMMKGLAKVENLRRLIICGGAMGGALAKVAALRLHAEEQPLKDMSLPSPDEYIRHTETGRYECLDSPQNHHSSQQNNKPTGMLVKTYGSPNVITCRGDDGGHTGEVFDLQHCSSKSSSWALPGDLLPEILSNNDGTAFGERTSHEAVRARKKIVEASTASARRSKAGCCSRRGRRRLTQLAFGRASKYEGLFNCELLTPSPLDKRSQSISGLDASLKCYTNSMCWHQLKKLMNEK